MTKLEELYKIFTKSAGIYTDTRKPLSKGVFFALRGIFYDGNKYASKALNQGAYRVIVDDFSLSNKSEKFIYVKNTYETLKKLANYHRKKLSCPVLAITGSNGKTTTKELIKAVVKKKYKTHGTIGNLNNNIGVPLTLLNIPLSSEFAIIEMGASHLKEIEELCLIAKPSHGFITNFGKAHVEGFGSEEAIIEGKSELHEFLSNSNGTIFVNNDHKDQLKKLNKSKFISFGKDIKSNHIISYSVKNKKLEVTFQQKKFISNLHGEYNFPNIAAAIIIGHHFNVPLNKIQKAIEAYKSNNNRSQLIKIKNFEIILDAYNANPSSMEAAIKSFHSAYPNESIVILGDMLELGKISSKSHKEVIKLLNKLSFSRSILIGENFGKIKTESKSFDKFKSTQDLTKYLRTNSIKEKHILIKGSRSMAMEKLLPFF